ncbi:hypothetical protein LH462_11405 [Laribacter hongkongensis]|uniref:Uncharacterized protein n=1 Tax=Laribacter hongkongensis TaxID=168471 RepID=A0ABD4SUA4_9NEIS|nr:hypothetical protein [Laribacter hongkongensis]MCG9027007.1 hypothetical protein [Laribacter hongkongensis]MCG9104325.1 hypothetical protein [Laribacter hongkongensis]MCG9114130.1 hypothetical protein [Laribacter hongkongensis]
MAYTKAMDISIGAEQIAVALAHGTLGSHLGVVFQGRESKHVMLHLMWHQRLGIDEFPQPGWIASVVPLGALASVQATALLRGMAQKYGGNNFHAVGSPDYGINLFAGRDAISIDGSYNPGKDCDGFTCASIIAEIFRKIGFPLVDLETWEPHPKNLAWARAIVCMLLATKVPEDHVEKVKSNIKGTRLRPEEVAAAIELPPGDRPAKHAAVQQRASELLTQLEASYPSPDLPGGPIGECLITYQKELSEIASSAHEEKKSEKEQAAVEAEELDEQTISTEPPAQP